MVTGWSAGRRARADRPAAGARRSSPPRVVLATGCRERPRSARLVPGSRPDGRDDDRDAPAARLPPGPARRAARARGRRRARELLGGHDARPRRRARARADHRAAAPPVAGGVPAGRARALPGARLDAHARERDPRPPARGGGRADRPRHGRDPRGRLRHGRVQRRLDPRPRAGRDRPGSSSTRARAGPAVDAALRTSRAGRVRGRQRRCTAPSRPTSPRSSGRHAAAGVARYLATASGRRARVPIVCEPPLGWIAPNAVSRAPARPGARPLRAARERRSCGRRAWRSPRAGACSGAGGCRA